MVKEESLQPMRARGSELIYTLFPRHVRVKSQLNREEATSHFTVCDALMIGFLQSCVGGI